MKRLFVFVLIGCIFILILNFLSIKATRYYQDDARIINQAKRELNRDGDFNYQKGKENILFLGSSEIHAGIIPEHFDSELKNKTHSINMGLLGMPSDPSYYILEDYLMKNPSPEYIIMELNSYENQVNPTSFNVYSIIGMRYPGELFDYIKYRKDHCFMINLLFPCKTYWKNLINYARALIFNKEELKEKLINKKEMIKTIKKDNGFFRYCKAGREIQISRTDTMNVDKISRDIKDPFQNKIILNFFDLTEHHDIKVIIINTPKNEIFYEREIAKNYRDFIGKLMNAYPNIHVLGSAKNLRFYDIDYFCDPYHLNMEGAKIFTSELAREFEITKFN